LFFSIATKDERRSVFSLDTFADKTFLLCTGISALAILVATVFGPLQTLLKTTSLDVPQWIICICVALSIIVATEVRKAIRRRETAPTPAELTGTPPATGDAPGGAEA
jgi:Ca2+-transporting ATPase